MAGERRIITLEPTADRYAFLKTYAHRWAEGLVQ
jgi:hypothetical protein